MKQISRKLRSNSGATMLIALMFMMFCLFVGGSVLAAASANGYRVKHLGDQQDTLNQRSAVWLISDELRAFDDNGNEIAHVLEVEDTKYEVQKVKVEDDGSQTPLGEPVMYRIVAFKAPEGLKMSPLQRLMYETTVWRYLEQNSVDLNDSNTRIQLSGFVYQDGTTFNALQGTAPNCFWYTAETFRGQIAIDCNIGSEDPFASYQAEFLCDNATGRLYDFLVTFGDHTTMSVVMNGSIWKETTSDSASATPQEWKWGGAEPYSAVVREFPNSYNIQWDDPEIRKGGN